jgi:hypothetical protein
VVDRAEARPLITFALVAYNQERFIAEAVQGALSQTYSPLEILLSDDCSVDRTFEIIQQEIAGYAGPHKVMVRRNEWNLGLGEHINRVMEIAQGELIIAAAGDDVSVPERAEVLFDAYIGSDKRALSVFSNAVEIDERGAIGGLVHDSPPSKDDLSLRRFSLRQASVSGATHAWHRRVFDEFGPMGAGVISEDAVIPFRSLLLGEVRYVDQPLVLRRHHDGNIWLHPRMASRESFVQWNVQRLSQRIQNNLAILETRLSDLQVFAGRCPGRTEEVDLLVEMTTSRIEECQLEEELWRGSLRSKLRTVRDAWGARVPLRRLARWCAMYSWPRAYFALRWFGLGFVRGGRRQ